MTAERIPSSDECNAIAELRELLRGLEKTNWSSWQTTAHFWRDFERAQAFLKDYDERNPNV